MRPALSIAILFFGCGGGAGAGSTHPNCDAYVLCVEDTTPESTGQAVSDYGPDSACWDDPDSSATCESACEAAISSAHQAFPGSESCDDGSPVASNLVIAVEHGYFRFDVQTMDGAQCDAAANRDFSLADTISIDAYFQPNDTTEFTAQLMEGINGGYEVWHTDDAECTNDGRKISCTGASDGFGRATFEGSVSADLQSLSGTYELGDYCTFVGGGGSQ